VTALVVGTRQSFALSSVRRFIQDNYGVTEDDFSIHRFHPEDFLLIFREAAFLEHVLQAPPLPVPDMVLHFRRWRRVSAVDAESMQFRVLVELRDIPSHAWSADTVQMILGNACACPEPTPATVTREDLRRFQAVVWCMDPDLIPNEATIRILEPIDRNIGANLYLRHEQIIFHSQPLLRHRVEVEILEIQDWMGHSSDSSDGPYDLPDRLDSESDDEDEHPGVGNYS
jgi:hypothetical protein